MVAEMKRESVQPESRRVRTREYVDATALGNLWAGIGGAVLTFSSLAGWVTYYQEPLTKAHGIVALTVGGVVYGALSLFRFSLDEIRESGQWSRLVRMNTYLVTRVAELERTVADQRSELNRLNERRRREELLTVAPSSKTKVEPAMIPALNDAYTILDRWAQRLPYNRDDLANVMSRSRWEKAMVLLDSAGVVGMGGPGNRQRVIVARTESSARQAAYQRAQTWEEVSESSGNYVTAG
jgi:hypothetical protein